MCYIRNNLIEGVTHDRIGSCFLRITFLNASSTCLAGWSNCMREVYLLYLLSKICKDDITKAFDAIIKHVLDKMDQKEVASMREALKDVIANKDNK